MIIVLAVAGRVSAQPAGGPPLSGEDMSAPPGVAGALSPEAGPAADGTGFPPGGEAATDVGAATGGGGAAPQASSSVMDIDRVEGEEDLYTLELRDADLGDLFRVLAHKYKLNILVDKDVSGTVTASLTNITLDEAMDRIAEMNHLIIERKGNVLIVKPDLITRVFVLKHIEAAELLQQGSSGSGDEGSGSTGGDTGVGQEGGNDPGSETGGETGVPASTSAETTTAGGDGQSSAGKAGSIYDLLSERGRVFLGRKPNSIMVIDHPSNVEKIAEYLQMVDKGMVSRVFHLKYISPADILHDVQSLQGTSGAEGGETGGGSTGAPPS